MNEWNEENNGVNGMERINERTKKGKNEVESSWIKFWSDVL